MADKPLKIIDHFGIIFQDVGSGVIHFFLCTYVKELQANKPDHRIPYVKGGGFYDKLGAQVGTENPKNGALATFIDRSG